ncbi:MAG: NAD(P)H-dependent oxidoreductase [Planctomycetia bacterium]
MRALIVYAQEEPKSFNGAMRDLAVAELTALGMQVEVSDLYAMNFDPVGGKRDFTAVGDPDYFKYAVEQTRASKDGGFVADLKAEQDKLFAADLLVFQFPLWWFGLPAILKGWVDRVLAAGLTYGGGRWYSDGVFRGKRAMIAFTAGGGQGIYKPNALNGDIDQILFPIQHGMLYFVGFDVLPPFAAWSPARISDAERAAYLDAYRERLRAWRSTPPINFPPLSAYDDQFMLKST